MRFSVIIQARCGSTRFPNKVLKKIGKFTISEIIKKRLEKSKLAKKIIFETNAGKKAKVLFDIM